MYSITKDGRVYSHHGKGKWLKLCNRGRGYMCVTLALKGKEKLGSVHRLVAIAYIENPSNYPMINHIDENPSNNHISNLEWCTDSHNKYHSAPHKKKIPEILKAIEAGEREVDIYKRFNVPRHLINNIKTKGRWVK